MLESVQKKKNLPAHPLKRIPFQLKGKITLALFPQVRSPLKYFFKKEPQSNSNICYKLLLTHRVRSWHFYFRIWHYIYSDMMTVCWGRKGVKWLSRRTRQTHLPPKLNNANYAGKTPVPTRLFPFIME